VYDAVAGAALVGRAPEFGNDAVRSAYTQGFQEGRAAGQHELEERVGAMNAQVARTVEELSGLRRRFRHEAEEDVVALALAIARRILHRELTVAPEALLGWSRRRSTRWKHAKSTGFGSPARMPRCSSISSKKWACHGASK
jgi:hypothetical protein